MFRRHTPASRWSSLAAPQIWRSSAHGFSFIVFISLALFLLVFSKMQPQTAAALRANSLDLLAPLFEVLSRPAIVMNRAENAFHNFIYLQSDNDRLRAENARIVEWQNAVVSLEKENRELRSLLRFKAEPQATYISARAIADTGGAFARGLVLTAGRKDGVREDMAVVTGDGLVGRVIEAGNWSSRVWLISDPNSRIPVTIAETGDRAILAGDNTTRPKLLFLARNASVSDGAHVLTSGHGGVFPPNVPIGVLKEIERGSFEVVPSADLGRITYVRVMDFNLEGGVFNAVGNKLRSESKKK